MEQHRALVGHETFRPDIHLGPHRYYIQAKKFTLEFYHETYTRILETKFAEVSLERFFREYVWTVHTSGFSAKAVSKFWDPLIAAYGSPREISSSSLEELIVRVSPVVNNPAKIKSVWRTANDIVAHSNLMSWETYRNSTLYEPDRLTQFGHVGPITKYHLARNIGLIDFVKPDLHLERMAKFWGYSSPLAMCQDAPDDAPLGLRDLVLWQTASTFGTQWAIPREEIKTVTV